MRKKIAVGFVYPLIAFAVPTVPFMLYGFFWMLSIGEFRSALGLILGATLLSAFCLSSYRSLKEEFPEPDRADEPENVSGSGEKSKET